MNYASVWVTLLFLAGCAPAYVQSPPSTDHPANPDAMQAAFVTPPDVLSTHRGDTETTEDNGAEMNHGDMAGMSHSDRAEAPSMQAQEAPETTLPDEAAEQLKNVLDAYLNIGDRLASDATEGIAQQAQRIGPAMDALVKVEIPDNPHIWHMHPSEIRTIRQQALALALAEADDLSAARTAYGVLSEALEQFLSATGVPNVYDTALFRYVCGMDQEASQQDIWLQLGEERMNPYGGPADDCQGEHLSMPQTEDTQQHEHDARQREHR